MTDKQLPSGVTATIRDGTGRDLVAAYRKAKQPDEVIFALMAELVTIGDRRLVYEDLLEMNLKDVLALQQAVVGDFFSPASPISSTSPNSPDGVTAS
jgi:hypothetical protein